MQKIVCPLIIIIVFCVETAKAQRDTDWVYMKNNKLTDRPDIALNKDSADFIRMIAPLDTSFGKKLYPISDFYLNGKLMQRGFSTNNLAVFPDLDGAFVQYYPNGNKKAIVNFENGTRKGNVIRYYPNGKAYSWGYYYKNNLKLIECHDSTGNVLAKNGNGKWIKYSDDFKNIVEEGKVKDSLEQGEWKGHFNNILDYECNYDKGVVTTGISYDNMGKQYPFKSFYAPPEFNGGKNAFRKFINRHFHYPEYDKQKKISGIVNVSFVVDTDGTLNDIHIRTGREKHLDEEVLRLMKLSPQWIPGCQYGIPMSMSITIPLTFNFEIGEKFNFYEESNKAF